MIMLHRDLFLVLLLKHPHTPPLTRAADFAKLYRNRPAMSN